MSQPVTPLRDLSEKEFPAPAARGPELVPPVDTGIRTLPAAGESSARRPRLVSTAGMAGGAAGRVVVVARRLADRMSDVRRGIRSRGAGTASATMGERVTEARNRAEFYAQQYPLQTLGAIFGTAFACGFVIRIWRSRG